MTVRMTIIYIIMRKKIDCMGFKNSTRKKLEPKKRKPNMFDLRFFKLVDQILCSDEHHQSPATSRDRALNKKYSTDDSITITVKDEDKLLRMYISLTYPGYFAADSAQSCSFRRLFHGSSA